MSHPSAPWSRSAPPAAPEPLRTPAALGNGFDGGPGGRVSPPPAPLNGPAGPPAAGAARTRSYFYHRLALTDPNHRWWMPLVEGLILVALIVVTTILFGIVMAFAVPGTLTGDFTSLDQMDPAVFFLSFASVALMLPCALLARMVLGPRPLGLIFSVAGRIRWRWLLTCFLVAAAVYVAVNAVGIGLDLAAGGAPTPVRPVPGFWWLMASVLLVVPVQCTAEEVVFRGYLAQTVGRWLKHPAWAILLPVPLFVFGHLYDVWGLLSVGIMAVSMGIVTWRTGGLEAGIALHAVNNMSISLLAMVGLVDMNETSGSPTDLISEVILNVLYIALVFWLVRQRPAVAVTRTVVLPPPPAPPRLPAPALRPAAMAADRSGMAVYPFDPATQSYLSLPPQYGPYVVRDGQGRYVGVLDTRPAAGPAPAVAAAPTYTEQHDAHH